MSTSRKNAILSEVAAQEPSPRTQAYFQSEAVGAFYEYVIGKFLEKERAGEITRAQLARRMHKDRASITRLLSRPSNITLATLSDLLLAIGGERPIPQSEPILKDKPADFPAWAVWDSPNQGVRLPPPLLGGIGSRGDEPDAQSQGKLENLHALS